MYARALLVSAVLLAAAPLTFSQQIHIVIPRRSELTPVQRLNRDGVDEVGRHRFEKAEALFYKAYLLDPADPFTLNNLGYVSELQGEVDRAADYYKLATEQGCDAVIDRSSDKHLKGRPMMDALGTIQNMPMRMNRVNTYAIQLISQGRGFEAQAVLEQALPQDPNNPFTLNNLAVADEAVGDLEGALKNYQAAADTHSKLPVIVSLKRSSRGKPISTLAAKSAEDLRTRMATMDIHQVRANMYAVRGVAALNNNDLPAARRNFEEEYSNDPESAFALNNRGFLAELDGEYETAVSFYARAQRAPGASVSVGLASQAAAHGEHLSSVARQSHDATGQELASQTPLQTPSSESIELLHHDGTPVDPPDAPSVTTPASGQDKQPAEPAPSVPADRPATPAASPSLPHA